MLKKHLSLIALIVSFTGSIFFPLNIDAQELSKADYERAVSFRWENLNNKKVFNTNIQANWYPDSTGFWFIFNDEAGRHFKQLKFDQMEIVDLFDREKIATGLANLTGEAVQPEKLDFETIIYVNKNTLTLSFAKKKFQLNLKDHSLELLEEEKKEINPNEKISPDKQWIAFSKNYNLFIKSTKTGEIHQLSKDGKKHYEYASYYGWFDKMEGENGDRPQRFAVNWSADSKWIQTNICDLRYANKMFLLDWSIDSLYRPKLLSYYRGSPGDTTMVHMIPVFYNIDRKVEIRPALPRSTHINSVSFRPSEKQGKAFVSYPERGYQKEHLYGLDLEQNKLDHLLTETSNTNIDNFSFKVIEEQDLIFFLSERSGWRQLYTLNLKDKKIKALTRGQFYIHRIAYIDEAKQSLYFLAAGKEATNNPYHQQLYKIKFDGSALKLLTPEPQHHEVSFSPDGQYFFDNYSTATIPSQSVLRRARTGKILKKLAEADIHQLNGMAWKAPQIFEAIGRDGNTKIYGALWKPSNFDPNKKYPLIDHSYTGPHTQVFPKSFRRVLSSNNQALAELGFIVMMVDGMGSSGRSKAFHDVSYKNMGQNLSGHILAIEQLGKKYTWIDTSRVGIFGHSAGGYDAGHAMLQFPEVYKVGVASSADHDFRMEKAWWPEMYMGWPVDSSYHQVSNITMAKNLKGKLLLVHGGLDDNVNPSATFKLAEALVNADKEFDLMIFPSQRHGYSGKHRNYFIKKRWNYFVKHLLGKEPIWKFEL